MHRGISLKPSELRPKAHNGTLGNGTLGDAYARSPSESFFERARAEARWFDPLCRSGLMPGQSHMGGAIGTSGERGLRDGPLHCGTNFGSQDYLSLATHPDIATAVREVLVSHGVHSAGSAALSGTLDIGLQLEREFAEFTGYADATLFPIGWAAGYGTITALVRSDDYVLIDSLAHACLQEGARSATRNVHRFSHLSCDSVEKRLIRIRNKEPKAGILVVTESLFSMDSDVPDIERLQNICTTHGACLMVDAAHDLGAIAPQGGGFLELQGMRGRVDILMASFSKSFASTGGIVACNEPSLKARLRFGCGPSTFTNAITPLQIAVIRKSLEIIRGTDGALRRQRLMNNSRYLRDGLREQGFEILGEPSAVVPVVLGARETSRRATQQAIAAGMFVNLVEYPAVSRTTSRWRLQVMADHTRQQIDNLISVAVSARAGAFSSTG